MSTSENDLAFGPKMAALKPQHQKFVNAYFSDDAGSSIKRRLIFAAVEAGYGGPKTKNNQRSMEYIGWRVSAIPEVKAAITEEGRRRNRLVLPIAVTAARNVLANPKHRDHGKIIMYYLSLIDPPGAQLDVKLEHVPPSVEATQAVIDRIAALAKTVGAALPALPAPPVLDAECIEVDDEG